ncbi:unnamed protein product [Calypogeia fissa]
MPDFEEDGSEGDSGEEDSMANFMGEEVSERADEQGHNLSGDDDEEKDDYESGSEKGARQDIANENEQAGYESASEEEQENYASGSEREASEGSVVGDEETGKKYVGLNEEDGNEFESEEAVSVPGRSFQGGRGLRTSTNLKQDFDYDSADGIKNSNFDHGGQNNSTGRLVAFSKEDSPSEQEDYDGSSDRDDLDVGGAKGGAHEDGNNLQNDNGPDEDVDEKEEEIDGEIEEKDSDEDYEADDNGEDDDSEFKADEEIPSKTSLRKNDLKALNFPGLRTNVRNGAFVPRLSKAMHFRQPPPDPEPEPEEAEAEVEALSESGHEPDAEYVESEAEDDDDEEEEADDPDDVDFNPSNRRKGRRHSKVDENSDSEDDAEDDFDDESLGSDESDDEDYKAGRKRAKSKPSRAAQPTRERVNRGRRNTRSLRTVSYSEASESSAKETDEDSDDEDYGRPQRRPASGPRGRSNRLETATSSTAAARGRRETLSAARETRTSSRSVPRKSYAESEESEDEENERAKKRAKVAGEDGEEEDGDAIEKVLWHQPRGIAEAELEEGRKAEPFVLDTNPHAELNWDAQEFYIKWKGQSYLHCEWQFLSDLLQLTGHKKVHNYMKKIEEERNIRKELSPEEAELHDVGKEMELDLLKQYVQVERVFASRTSKSETDEEVEEYLVKWKGLSYGESTWEKDTDIAFAQDAIDEFKNREALSSIQGKTVDMQRRKNKASLRKLEAQPEWLKGGTLRDYQLEGLNFLMISWRNDTNVILADEMGLGKTVQSVSMLGFLQYSQQIHGPFLVVVPLSTITNWAKEFRKWLPEMNVVVYVGNRASREMCQKYEFSSGRKTGRPTKFDTLLTTYEVVLKDKAVLANVKWNYLMVDEAHRLKNSEASLYTTLSEFNAKNKVLVTGTPLQNSVEELWALLHFLDSDKFRNKDEFAEKYKNLNSFNERELANLHGELRPHILRRVIRDVEKSLPPKIERILRVEMSPLQRRYYKWILERNFQDLNKGVRGNKQVSLLNIVVELKKCCNHPFLFESADHAYGGDGISNDNNKVQNIVLSSGKLVILDKLLIRLKETNHRVLIFSQMVKMLDILANYMSLRGFQFQRLDGSTRAELRHQAMEHFNAPGSEDFCFLLSTRAGGLGINLATADTVIIFDSDWNPQNDLQAMSRAHRIGQRDVVNIYRFVTMKSVEEDILERAKKKMVLDHLVIQKLNAQGRLEKKETKKDASIFDKSELAAILRFGAEELFKDDKPDEEVKNKLESMDIDEILERAEKVESQAPELGPDGKELLSGFKVANLSNTEDDATFWSRLIPPDVGKEAEKALEPRSARNVRTYAEDTPVGRNSRKRRATEIKERPTKRSALRANKSVDLFVPQSAPLDGAAARVSNWTAGNLSKRDATAFVKAVKKFGDQSRLKTIAKECGGAVDAARAGAQLQLWEGLVNGCKDALRRAGNEKAAVLDFFGVPVKAQEILSRVKELAFLAKRVNRFSDPVAQFRLKSHPRNPSWSKICSWTQVDDARLLLGVYYHGLGNWEKIRTDERLRLNNKIAPAGASAAETSLPRSTHLEARVNVLLRKELEDAGEANGLTGIDWPKKEKAASKRDRGDNHGKHSSVDPKERHGKSGPANQGHKTGNSGAARERTEKVVKVAEPAAKEEGEISDAENTPQPPRGRMKEALDKDSKEGKWHEWCAQIMEDQARTLNRLEKLQTSYQLSKEETLHRVKKYLRLLGRKVEEILEDNAQARNLERMETRLWNYVATFSTMTGSRLAEIYKKLKEAPAAEPTKDTKTKAAAAGPSGRDPDSNAHGGSNHVSSSHPGGKRFTSLTALAAEAPYNRDYERERGDADTWQRQRDLDRERDAEAWQRNARDSRVAVGGAGGMYNNMNDRRQWDGRPGSSEGWGDRGLLRQPGLHVAPGILANGNGWSQDPRARFYPGVGGGRGPLDRERNWNGEHVFIHHGRGGGRGL